jgi:hypothetical protein
MRLVADVDESAPFQSRLEGTRSHLAYLRRRFVHRRLLPEVDTTILLGAIYIVVIARDGELD